MNLVAGIIYLVIHAAPSNSLICTEKRFQITSFVSLSNRRLDNPYPWSTLTLKDAPNQDPLAKYGSSVFGVAIYDTLFKYILDDADIRLSFFCAFIPGINMTSSERLDESMNPLKEFQVLRRFINDKETKNTVENLKNFDIEVRRKKRSETEYVQYKKCTDFLIELLNNFGDIIKGFPSESYEGRMDFACRLDTGEFVVVE